jgi:hypothetical protein
MKKFSELNIEVPRNEFVGDKIKIQKVFNKEIEIHGFKVEPSKHNDSILLTIQTKIDDEFRIVFCGSKHLKTTLEAVPSGSFPFKASIINNDQGYSLQ